VPSLLLDGLVPGSIIHPGRYRQFLAGASGITMVMDSLASFCPAGIPTETIWAGFQEDLPWNMPRDHECRRQLGIDDDESVVAYTGNVHKANWQEVASLYLAIALLHRNGVRIKLVRTGSDSVHPLKGAAARARSAYCIELGHIPRPSLPRVHSISDVLVQPGEPGPFNDFRFPSKLPEYLASGKPVLLPNTNIGRFLRDREECVYLSGGAPAQLASGLQSLLADPVLREKVGAGGRSFADRHLRPSQIAARLRDFYSSVLGARPSPAKPAASS